MKTKTVDILCHFMLHAQTIFIFEKENIVT
jgi:hypothetical protein